MLSFISCRWHKLRATYEDLTLIDPQPDARDDAVLRLCSLFREKPAGVRNAQTPNDFYLLLRFAQRAAVFALRQKSPEWIEQGLTAVAIIDDERIEPDDVEATLALLYHAATQIGADAPALFARAAEIATSGVGQRMKRAQTFALQHQQVGDAFVDRDPGLYMPTRDLGRMAVAVRDLLERDRYHVQSVAVATTIPAVWFDTPEAAVLLSTARGAAAVRACEKDDYRQAVVAFLAELDGARQLASLATKEAGAAVLAVAHETLLALMIARSFVEGAPPAETTESLQRFAAPLRAILAS